MKIVCIGLAALLAAFSNTRIFSLSWSDARLVEMAQTRPELLRPALRRDPASPFRWCELGFALLEQGHEDAARKCFQRALALGPNLVSNLSFAAQFYTRIGERIETLRCFARILELAPSYRDTLFPFYTSSDYRLLDTLNYGMPPDPAIARDYLRLLMRNELEFPSESSGVTEAWAWLAQRGIPDQKLTNEYVDYLVRTKDYDRAHGVWSSYLGVHAGDYLNSEFVYNGGFETAPSGAIFDWRIGPAQGVEVARDSQVVRSGSHALRVEFGGEANLHYNNVVQELILGPGVYRLHASLRTEGISTDQGIALHVYDPESSARLDFKTRALRGTNGWTRIQQDFAVPKGARRVRLEVFRERSWKFDNLIKGRVWIDDVSVAKTDQDQTDIPRG